VSQKQYARDLIVMSVVTGLTVTATIAFGPFAGLAVFGVCLIVGGLVGIILAVAHDVTELDRALLEDRPAARRAGTRAPRPRSGCSTRCRPSRKPRSWTCSHGSRSHEPCVGCGG
jgi:hypothetical protein